MVVSNPPGYARPAQPAPPLRPWPARPDPPQVACGPGGLSSALSTWGGRPGQLGPSPPRWPQRPGAAARLLGSSYLGGALLGSAPAAGPWAARPTSLSADLRRAGARVHLWAHAVASHNPRPGGACRSKLQPPECLWGRQHPLGRSPHALCAGTRLRRISGGRCTSAPVGACRSKPQPTARGG